MTRNEPTSRVTLADGASRATQTLVHMRVGGSGPNPSAGNASFLESGRGVIRTDIVLDGNGRVSELIDGRGGKTAFTYDTLDRQLTLTFHDGSVRTNTYNDAGDVVTYVDENGSAFANTYDAAGRLTAVAITAASNVATTTWALGYQYDGLFRLTQAVNTGSPTVTVAFCFDSLGRVLEESQPGPSFVTNNAFTSYVATTFTFPSGRTLSIGYDLLYRKNAISDGSGSIANWLFFGSRVATVDLGNGIVCSFMNNNETRSAIQAGLPTPGWGTTPTSDQLGYDGAGRAIAKRYMTFTGGASPEPASLIVGFTTAYDRSGNKLYERHLHAESRSHLYPNYDSPNRLLEYQRGTLVMGGGSIATPIALSGTKTRQAYTLDGLGNWASTFIAPVDEPSATQYRRHNYVNQIVQVGGTNVLYDHGNNAASVIPSIARRGNGNIVDDGTLIYQYDALNRLVQVNRKSDTFIMANYFYDALGRRVWKQVYNGGIPGTVPNVVTTYVYSGARCVTESAAALPLTIEYVWGQYIDELIQMTTNNPAGPQSLPAGAYYPLSDLLYRSVALTDDSGNVVEAYDTDAYGNTLLFSAAGTGGNWFADDATQADYSACRYVFTGREFDAETGIYFYRARYYSPGLGRFISRDPSGYAHGSNLYQFVDSRPVSLFDPRGLGADPNYVWSVDQVLAQANAALAVLMLMQRFLPQRLFDLSALNALAPAFDPGGADNGKNRFIYTCKCGWIDVGHFFGSARAAGLLQAAITSANARNGTPGPANPLFIQAAVYAGGFGLEMWQAGDRLLGGSYAWYSLKQLLRPIAAMAGIEPTTFQHFPYPLDDWSWSAFTYEDLPSDMLGAGFGATIPTNVLSAFANLMKKCGAVDPNKFTGDWASIRQLLKEDASAWDVQINTNTRMFSWAAVSSGAINFTPLPRRTQHCSKICDDQGNPKPSLFQGNDTTSFA